MKEGDPMCSLSHIAQTLQKLLNERVETLAKETGFIPRVRAFTGADFAQTLIFGWLQEPEVTIDGLTQILQRREVTISGPGLSQRFTPQSAHFLQCTLKAVQPPQPRPEAVDIGLFRHLSGLCVEDSS